MIEDVEAENLEEEEIIDQREIIKTINKQNAALKSCILRDMYISENPKESEECQKESKDRLERNKATYEKNEEEKKKLLERLGIKISVLQKEMEDLQKEKKDLGVLIEEDKKIVADLDSTPYEIEAAEARIEQREKEKEWITTRLNAAEQDLGFEDDRPLLEKIKEIFKKFGVTVTAIFLAAGVTIATVVGVITKVLKATGKALGNGLK